MQESSRDNVVLLPDGKESLVNELAHSLNLRRVGWIFTDLIADDVKKGTVSKMFKNKILKVKTMILLTNPICNFAHRFTTIIT